ncbi:MAG: TauD/TfdA dioxygenase family protein [Burkholderiales bacterium]
MSAGAAVGERIKVRGYGAPLGFEIKGVDLSRDMSDATFREIDDVLNDKSVIFFRDQKLGAERQVEFSARFGRLDVNLLSQYLLPGHPEVLIVSNIIEGGLPIGNMDAGHHWHTDLSYLAEPSRCTILYAVEVPVQDGKALGDTMFSSTYEAYDALSAGMKSRLAGLKAIHSYAGQYDRRAEKIRQAGGVRENLTEDQKKKVPDVAHPIVRTHPFTGRKCLYVSAGMNTGIVGMPQAEAEVLLQELFAHVIRPEFLYRHSWKVGDLVIWDNCSAQHRAISDFALPLRRRMHRTTVIGSAPY